MRKKTIAVFLDRDGTINEDVGYLDDPADVKLLDGVADAIRLLNQRGLKIIIITNQSGVARGYLTEEQLQGVNRRVVELLEKQGARVDAIYYCPHHPEDGCNCRKPMPGLLERASEELHVELEGSYMVGDKHTDVLTAKSAGVKGVLVGENPEPCDDAHHVCRTLYDAVRWILKDLEASGWKSTR